MKNWRRDMDRGVGPKPWTSDVPPKPYSRRVFDGPWCLGLALILVGLLLSIWGAPHVGAVRLTVGNAFLAIGLGLQVIWCFVDLRRWFQERRWRRSPGPRNTLDDAL